MKNSKGNDVDANKATSSQNNDSSFSISPPSTNNNFEVTKATDEMHMAWWVEEQEVDDATLASYPHCLSRPFTPRLPHP